MNKLDESYLSLVRDILDNGVRKSDRTGTGTISVFGRQIRHRMSDGFPILTTKRVSFNTIVNELLWFLRGGTKLRDLINVNCNIWNGDAYKHYQTYMEREVELNGAMRYHPMYGLSMQEFIDRIMTDDRYDELFGDLGPIYGRQWRKWDGKKNGMIDQVSNLIDDLKNGPDSRRLMVTAWNPDDIQEMILPPCHYGFQMYTSVIPHHERCKLFGDNDSTGRTESYADWLDSNGFPKRYVSLLVNIRSSDVPLGLPFNISSYGLLLCIIARMVNMVPMELIVNTGDTHIYLNQVDAVREQLSRPMHLLPTLFISDSIQSTGSIDDMLSKCTASDFKLNNYVSGSTIHIPLSN